MADLGPCPILVLAAGGSKRMGRAKQLLLVDGLPLLRRAVLVAIEARPQAVVVVLGAEAGRVRTSIADLDVRIVVNERWREGLASSLSAGTSEIERILPDARGLIAMPADQPRLRAAHLRAIDRAQRERGAAIVATDYGDHRGPPAYFGRLHFPALKSLRGDVGARELLRGDAVETVAAEPGSGVDVDRPRDLARFQDG
jgi:molybdenum cofactor cytidylyltransferase